jgi:hypothetical protein
MRTPIAFSLCLALVAAPAAAHAADWSGCLLGPTDVNRCSVSGGPAAVLAAIAAPVLVAGAAVTVAHELHKRTDERQPDGDDPGATPQQRTPPNLTLVPTPAPDPYRTAAGTPERRRATPNRAFQFNETATNVGLAVGGAMVVGAMVATIVKSAHK